MVEIDTHKWRRSWSVATLGEMRRIVSKLRGRRYDVALDFQGLWKSAFLGKVSGARKLIGFDRTTLKEPGCRMFYDEQIKPAPAVRHVIDIYKELLRSLGVTPGPHRFHLSVPSEDQKYISQQLSSRQIDDFIILNPGGGWDTKNWAPENYALLHDKLSRETGLPSVLTWGPGEEPLVDSVLRACVGTPPVTFPTSLYQLIALLRRAKLFVGGDTGPLHLAAACGTPIVGVFGPTDPLRNGPFLPEDIVVSHQVPCGPCYKRTCPIYNKECLAAGPGGRGIPGGAAPAKFQKTEDLASPHRNAETSGMRGRTPRRVRRHRIADWLQTKLTVSGTRRRDRLDNQRPGHRISSTKRSSKLIGN